MSSKLRKQEIKTYYDEPKSITRKTVDESNGNWATFALTRGLWDDEEMIKQTELRKEKGIALYEYMQSMINSFDFDIRFQRDVTVTNSLEHDDDKLTMMFSDKISTLSNSFSFGMFAKTDFSSNKTASLRLANYSGWVVSSEEYIQLQTNPDFNCYYGVELGIENWIILGNPLTYASNFNTRTGFPEAPVGYKCKFVVNNMLSEVSGKTIIPSSRVTVQLKENTKVKQGEELYVPYGNLIRHQQSLSSIMGLMKL